jgi:hypothetical protein
MRSRVNDTAPLSFNVKRYWPCGIAPEFRMTVTSLANEVNVLPGWAWPAGGGVELLSGSACETWGTGISSCISTR